MALTVHLESFFSKCLIFFHGTLHSNVTRYSTRVFHKVEIIPTIFEQMSICCHPLHELQKSPNHNDLRLTINIVSDLNYVLKRKCKLLHQTEE